MEPVPASPGTDAEVPAGDAPVVDVSAPFARLVVIALAAVLCVQALLEPLATGGRGLVAGLVGVLGALLLVAAVVSLSVRRDATASGGRVVLEDAAPVPTGAAAVGTAPALASSAGRVAGALAAAGVLTAVRALVAGEPVGALDAALCILVAGCLLTGRRVGLVGTVVTAGWAGVAGFGAVRDLIGAGAPVIGSAATGPASLADWLLALTGVAGSFGLSVVVCRHAADLRLDALREQARARALSVRDGLTGLNNRRGLEMVALPMVENARRNGQAVHCLYLDVDDFRAVNESHGTEVGDEVLLGVAEALMASVRGTDVVARWSGDEFVVVGPGTGTSPLELERRIRAQLAAAPQVAGQAWAGRVSIGSATLVPWDDGNLDSLLRRADQDMALRRSLRRQSRDRGVGVEGPFAGQG